MLSCPLHTMTRVMMLFYWRRLKSAPYLKNMYNETTGRTLRMFYLADATAEFRDLMTINESFKM